MAIHGKAGGSGGDFEPCPEGPQQLVCCDVVDLGVLDVTWQGQIKRQHKIQIRWQSQEHDAKDGKPFLLVSRYTLSMHEKANLRKVLEQWRGRKFDNDAAAEAFDIESVIGANGFGNVIHNKGEKGGVFANLASIMPLPKGMPKASVRDYIRMCDRDDYKAPEKPQPAEDDDFRSNRHDDGPDFASAPSVDDIPF